MKWSEAATGGVWRRKKNGSLWNIYCMSSKGSLVATVSAVPHMLASSSELSPQSSLPSQTHVWSLHKVLLQMNSSARQKNAPAVTQNTTLLLKLLSERRKTRLFYLINCIFFLKWAYLSFIIPSRSFCLCTDTLCCRGNKYSSSEW